MTKEGVEQDVLLLICDVSGYTRYMLDSQEAHRHGYLVIAELMQAVLRQTRSPLQVAKLEGDAVFLYALLPPSAPGSPDDAQQSTRIRHQIGQFFTCFETKLAELVQSNVCACGGCTGAGNLRLKVIVHYGQAVFHRIARYAELAGVDVIVAHRLLKNTVHQEQYLLLTDAARTRLWQGEDAPGEAHSEQYDDLGAVSAFVLAPADIAEALPAPHPDYTTLLYKTKNIVRRVFQSRLLALGLKPMRPLTHPTTSSDPR